MKISTFVIMLTFVGVIMFAMFQMVNEAEDNYNIDINESDWEERYDFAEDINEEIQPIKDSIDTIQNQEAGWLERVGSGFTGIIAAVTFLPSILWDILTLSTGLATGLGLALAIPAYIITVAIIMLSIWAIFKLIEFYQRWVV